MKGPKPNALGKAFLDLTPTDPFQCGFCGTALWYPPLKIPIKRPRPNSSTHTLDIMYLPICIDCILGKEFKKFIKKVGNGEFTPSYIFVLRGERLALLDLTTGEEETLEDDRPG